MDIKKIIKLYDLGILDCDGNVLEGAVEDMGYEDGEAFGRTFVEGTPCGFELELAEMELNLKILYCLSGSHEFMSVLVDMGDIFEFEFSEEGQAVRDNEEALNYYLEHFMMGFSDVLLERYGHRRKCRTHKSE